MKRTVPLLLSLFILTTFGFSFASATSNSSESLQEQTFATPEQTWDQFKAAILDGDFDAAQKCCCQSNSKGVLKFEKMDAEKRKNIILSMQELTKIHQQEDKAKYKLIRNSNGANFSTFVYFEKIDDEWKIENY